MDNQLKKAIRKLSKFFFFLKDTIKRNFTVSSWPTVKLLLFLIFSTVLMHIAVWVLDHFLRNAWVHGSTLLEMRELLELGTDGGYPEHFQYILLFWCFLLSSFCVLKLNLKKAAIIPLVYLFLFLDDSLSLHDYLIGPKIIEFYENSSFFQQILTPRLIHIFSEVTFWGIVGSMILIFSWTAITSKSDQVRRFMFNNFTLFALMAFFGILVDAITPSINNLVQTGTSIDYLLTMGLHLVEEVGELLSIGLACTWLFGLSVDSVETKF